jgi:hypothetical protein
VDEIVRDHAKSDPTLYPLQAAMVTTIQTVAVLQHGDTAFASDPPFLSGTKPTSLFERPPPPKAPLMFFYGWHQQFLIAATFGKHPVNGDDDLTLSPLHLDRLAEFGGLARVPPADESSFFLGL